MLQEHHSLAVVARQFRGAALFLAIAATAFGGAEMKDVRPIFESNCAGCHATNVKMGSLDLDSYASILKGGNHGAVVVPGKSAESRLYLMISGKMTPAMPLGNKPLAAGDIETIKAWIDAGAPAPA